MEPIAGVEFVQGDFRDDVVLHQLEAMLDGQKVDLVVCDMAPDLAGVSSAGSARLQHVVKRAMGFACAHLKADGTLLARAFHGSSFSKIVETFKRHFRRVVERKPKDSRDKSSETFLVARGLKN